MSYIFPQKNNEHVNIFKDSIKMQTLLTNNVTIIVTWQNNQRIILEWKC
jgi:hypothetical protein